MTEHMEVEKTPVCFVRKNLNHRKFTEKRDLRKEIKWNKTLTAPDIRSLNHVLSNLISPPWSHRIITLESISCHKRRTFPSGDVNKDSKCPYSGCLRQFFYDQILSQTQVKCSMDFFCGKFKSSTLRLPCLRYYGWGGFKKLGEAGFFIVCKLALVTWKMNIHRLTATMVSDVIWNFQRTLKIRSLRLLALFMYLYWMKCAILVQPPITVNMLSFLSTSDRTVITL